MLDSNPQPSQRLPVKAPLDVLLVEDNETDVYVIREVLRNSGLEFQLHVSRDGQDALSYLQDGGGAALVLLDLNVPKVAGLEVLRQLRGDSRYSRTCVVVVSSSDSESDRKAVERLGVEAYFRKPADLRAYRELAGVIKKVLGFR